MKFLSTESALSTQHSALSTSSVGDDMKQQICLLILLVCLPAQHKAAVKFTLEGHTGYIHELSFSPDGKLLLTVDNKFARLWDAETGALKFTLVHEEAKLMESETFWAGVFNKKRDSYESDVWAGFYGGGTVVVTWGSDGYLKRWDPATGRFLSTFALTTEVDDQWRRRISMINLRDLTTPDRRLTIRQVEARGYEMVDIATGEVKIRRGSDGYPSSLSPDGTMILTSRKIVKGVFKLDQYEHLLWDLAIGKYSPPLIRFPMLTTITGVRTGIA
jgi:WD40 repeat protein